MTIADLIDELNSLPSCPDHPSNLEYQRAGFRLAMALAGCSRGVIHGHWIYQNTSHPDGRWSVSHGWPDGMHRLLPWAVRLGLREPRDGDFPSEWKLLRRYKLPIASCMVLPDDFAQEEADIHVARAKNS